MNYLKQISIVLAVICVSACMQKHYDEAEYMVFDDVKIVSDFKEIAVLSQENGEEITYSKPNIKNFIVTDSVLIIDTGMESGISNVISTVDYSDIGSFFDKGKAFGEFLLGIDLGLRSTLALTDDSLKLIACDYVLGKVYSINLSKFIATGEKEIKEPYAGMELPRPIFWLKAMNDTSVIVRTLEDNETREVRYLISENGAKEIDAFSRLNRFQVPSGEDFNIMSSLMALSPDREICVEPLVGLNYINVYSPFGTKAFTISVDKEPYSLSEITKIDKADRPYVFADVRAHNFGFAVLKYGVTDREFQEDIDYKPSILLFDWNGNPLGEVKSEFKFNHFDIDEAKGELYVLDADGKLLKYPLQIPGL